MVLPQTPQRLRVIGLMSGTSVDSIDACGVLLQGKGGKLSYDVEATYTHPIPEAVRQTLLQVMADKYCSLETYCRLNLAVGELFAQAALALMAENGWTAESVSAIGSHGQTIFHLPPPVSPNELTLSPHGGTLQIGEPSIIAERTGVLTVADFRPRDMAAGGQGAPLVCLADQLLFHHPERLRCIQNIGGIANVTAIPAEGEPVAFDNGPGNMLMDAACQDMFQCPYDEGGAIAARGQVIEVVLATMLEHPYYRQSPPKTTGREMFGRPYWDTMHQAFPEVSGEDWLATLTALTAKSIVASTVRYVFPQCLKRQEDPVDVVVGGGGGLNPVLMAALRAGFQLSGHSVQLQRHEEYGIDGKYKEALAFAILAWATLNHLPGNLPPCTGASRPVVLGKVVPAR